MGQMEFTWPPPGRAKPGSQAARQADRQSGSQAARQAASLQRPAHSAGQGQGQGQGRPPAGQGCAAGLPLPSEQALGEERGARCFEREPPFGHTQKSPKPREFGKKIISKCLSKFKTKTIFSLFLNPGSWVAAMTLVLLVQDVSNYR